jgi:hypothetical protein
MIPALKEASSNSGVEKVVEPLQNPERLDTGFQKPSLEHLTIVHTLPDHEGPELQILDCRVFRVEPDLFTVYAEVNTISRESPARKTGSRVAAPGSTKRALPDCSERGTFCIEWAISNGHSS